MVFQCNSVGGLFQQKFPRTSEDTLGTFLLRFRGLSVLHCHCVSVWPRVFSALSKYTFFAAISWLVRSSLPWCFFQCGGGCFPNFQNTHYRVFWCDFVACPSFTAMVFQCGRVVFSAQVSEDFSRHVREFFAAISRLVHPSPSWRFSVAGCCFSTSFYGFQKTISRLVRPSLPLCFSVAGGLVSAAEISMDF